MFIDLPVPPFTVEVRQALYSDSSTSDTSVQDMIRFNALSTRCCFVEKQLGWDACKGMALAVFLC